MLVAERKESCRSPTKRWRPESGGGGEGMGGDEEVDEESEGKLP